MNASQNVTKYYARIPRNADAEAYQALSDMFDRLTEAANMPIPSNVNPNNYSRKIVVKSNIRNKTPNGIFRLFTAGDTPYEESKNIFRLFQR